MNNDFANIPRDYGATLFLRICETNLWQIPRKLPSRRTFNTQSLPMHGSPSEANDVLVSEAKGTTEENCSRTVEIGYEALRFSVEGQ